MYIEDEGPENLSLVTTLWSRSNVDDQPLNNVMKFLTSLISLQWSNIIIQLDMEG